MGDTNIEQLVDFPTRRENTLELPLTNDPSFVTSIEDTTRISDHDRIVIADYNLSLSTKSTNKKNYSFMESS